MNITVSLALKSIFMTTSMLDPIRMLWPLEGGRGSNEVVESFLNTRHVDQVVMLNRPYFRMTAM